MNVTNQNQETDSFKITKNDDGSYTADWDPQDPNWKWLNGLTGKELGVIIEQAVKEHQNGQL